MAKWNFVLAALGATFMSIAVARRGLPPHMVALLVRMTLPLAPNVSDMLVTMQAAGPWHHFVASAMA